MKDDAIEFDDEELEAASHWYSGSGSMLYAITSTGSLSRGTIRPRNDDGEPMTDEEWMAHLAAKLELEAEEGPVMLVSKPKAQKEKTAKSFWRMQKPSAALR